MRYTMLLIAMVASGLVLSIQPEALAQETTEPSAPSLEQEGLPEPPPSEPLVSEPGEPSAPPASTPATAPADATPDETASAGSTGEAPPPGCMGGGGIESMIPLVGMIAIIYFLIIRPQQKHQKQLRNMRQSLGKGDRIVTTGGIHGVVVNLKDDRIVVVKVADNVKLEVDRDAIGAVSSSSSREDGE